MKIGDKVKVRIAKSAMNSTPVEMDLVVAYIDYTDKGVIFYGGRNSRGKMRYFNNQNVLI